jgi:hypothetical protein
MQPLAHSKSAVHSVNPLHNTVEDLSWDLGSVDHRVAQLENTVKQMKAEINRLMEELKDVQREKRPRKTASSPLRGRDLAM